MLRPVTQRRYCEVTCYLPTEAKYILQAHFAVSFTHKISNCSYKSALRDSQYLARRAQYLIAADFVTRTEAGSEIDGGKFFYPRAEEGCPIRARKEMCASARSFPTTLCSPTIARFSRSIVVLLHSGRQPLPSFVHVVLAALSSLIPQSAVFQNLNQCSQDILFAVSKCSDYWLE